MKFRDYEQGHYVIKVRFHTESLKGLDSSGSCVHQHDNPTGEIMVRSTVREQRFPFFHEDAFVFKHDKLALFLPEPQELQ